jgi:hypothetical protein
MQTDCITEKDFPSFFHIVNQQAFSEHTVQVSTISLFAYLPTYSLICLFVYLHTYLLTYLFHQGFIDFHGKALLSCCIYGSLEADTGSERQV